MKERSVIARAAKQSRIETSILDCFAALAMTLSKLLKNFSIIIIFALLLIACGFHLRGHIVIPQNMKRIYLESPATFSQFQQSLKHQLQNAGALLVEDPKEADLGLVLIREDIEKIFESVGTNVQLHQYNLKYSLQYQLRYHQFAFPPQLISTSRVYRENANQQLGSTEEGSVLVSEMQNEVLQDLMIQLFSPTTLQKLRMSQHEIKPRPTKYAP